MNQFLRYICFELVVIYFGLIVFQSLGKSTSISFNKIIVKENTPVVILIMLILFLNLLAKEPFANPLLLSVTSYLLLSIVLWLIILNKSFNKVYTTVFIITLIAASLLYLFDSEKIGLTGWVFPFLMLIVFMVKYLVNKKREKHGVES